MRRYLDSFYALSVPFDTNLCITSSIDDPFPVYYINPRTFSRVNVDVRINWILLPSWRRWKKFGVGAKTYFSSDLIERILGRLA